ncbi:MAG TPA: zf-HC2 domain-containing protein, partial [Acidimicrobiia bacterium]|nr:zf-HC2 domain-containing protein [Acidimicrobiia bacterium]
MTWHADPETLHGYTQGRISAVQASSVEAHLLACAACRSSLAAGADRARLAAVWSEITAAADAPVPGAMERLLGRLGVPEHVGRLLAATPALR